MLVQPWACTPGPTYGPVKPVSVLLSFSAFAYAFGGHGMYPEEIREMEDPKEWPKVMYWSYGIILPMYFLCAFMGFFAYGTFANANINVNFPDNTMNHISIVVQLIFTYYCIFSSSLVVMLYIEVDFLGVTPTAVWQYQSFGLPAVVVRFIFRTLFVGSQIGLCELLLGGTGDTLLSLQSLAGAVGMSAFTYFLPFVCHWELMGEKMGTCRKIWYSVNIVFGVAIMLGGLYSATDDLVSSSDSGSPMCHLAYAYAPFDPLDPCFNTTIPTGPFGFAGL
jgi:solute carrier family 36 (proton-coupled amino acid transporter)